MQITNIELPWRQPIVLIPAYKPDRRILEVVEGLKESKNFTAIICVDDGSGKEYQSVFEQLSKLGVVVLGHCTNLGKGASLKTGFNAINCAYPDVVGVITCDADGQHAVQDIINVGKALSSNPKSLILGTRIFGKKIPLRSKIGNLLTKNVVQFLLGVHISDTQTGLRGIPLILIPYLLKIPANGYDFEMAMLTKCITNKVPIQETSIKTVYIDNNKGSHFQPLYDSFAIYFILIRYGASSFITAILDFSVFYIFLMLGSTLLTAMIVARIIAGTFNFLVSKKFVFKSKNEKGKEIVLYIILVSVLMLFSYASIASLVSYHLFSPFAAKIFVEVCIFFLSFSFQKVFVFKRHASDSAVELNTK